jgi:hypothetical protein
MFASDFEAFSNINSHNTQITFIYGLIADNIFEDSELIPPIAHFGLYQKNNFILFGQQYFLLLSKLKSIKTKRVMILLLLARTTLQYT